MTFLTKLAVINQMLALLGETPLNTLDEDHELTSSMLGSLTTANFKEQAKSWWFNQETIRLTPDAVTGFIMIPSDCIRVDPTDTCLNYVARGRRLYKPYAPPSENKFVFTSYVDCQLIRLLDFEDLPLSAQLMVAASAKLDFQTGYDGDDSRTATLKLEYRDAYITLNTEHIRNKNVNLLRRPALAGTMWQLGIS